MYFKATALVGATLLAAGCFGSPELEGVYRLDPEASHNSKYVKETEIKSDKLAELNRQRIRIFAQDGGRLEIKEGQMTLLGQFPCSIIEDKEFSCVTNKEKPLTGTLHFDGDVLVLRMSDEARNKGHIDTFLFNKLI